MSSAASGGRTVEPVTEEDCSCAAGAGWISNSSRTAPSARESSTSTTAWRANQLVRRALGRRMATFRTYAEVLRPDHVQVKAYEAGLTCGPPGLILADILQRTGGVYETTLPLDPRMRDDIREVAELTSDEDLRRIADLSEVPVPLGHLRHLDPQTRIVVGARLDYTDQEGQWLHRRPGRADTGIATLLGDHVIPGDSRS